MGFFRRARDFPGRISQMDSILLLLIAVGVLWLVGISNPQRFIAPIASGPSCTSMAAPQLDNSRSLLAVTDDQQELELSVSLSENVAPNGTLRIDVIFVNPDQGPVTIYLPENPVIFSNLTPGTLGQIPTISLVITNVSTNQTWYAAANYFVRGNAAPSSFDSTNLYLLLADEQCYVRAEYTFDQLTAAPVQMTPGQYRVQAFYNNSNPGTPNPAAFTTSGAIVNAPFPTQGVWVGNIQSGNEFLFNLLASAPTPAP